MAGKKRIQRAILATFAVLVLATACGRAAAPGATNTAQEIRDPDNPYFAGHIPAAVSSGAAVVRDPDNPYWIGSTSFTGETPEVSGVKVVRDPDNPYWNGR
jgi:ABC-type sugar transport system substrate-binding protein